MRNYGFDITSLFSGLKSNSVLGSFNLNDYAAIKNGSYGKLVKANYAQQKKVNSTDKKPTDDKVNNKTNKKNADTTGLSQIKKYADGLRAATEALNKDELWKMQDGKYDIDKIATAVTTFAKEYNDVINQSSKVNSKDIIQGVSYMSSMSNTMSKVLAKIGIVTGANGKLSVDEDTLKKADVKTIQSLFDGQSTYGSMIGDRAAEISKNAVMNSSLYSEKASLTNTMDNIFNKWI